MENYVYVYKVIGENRYAVFASERSWKRSKELACWCLDVSIDQIEFMGSIDPDEEGTFIII